MGSLSLPHLIIVALVVLVLFGRGRISEMMGDFGKGIKSFKQGMNEEERSAQPQIGQSQVPPPAASENVSAPAPVASPTERENGKA